MKIKLYTLLIIAILLVGIFIGKKWSNHTNTPEVIRDTIVMYDTIIHDIPSDVHHYHETITEMNIGDTVYIPIDVDTSAILANYFRTYKYIRKWNDSIINIKLIDFITQNKILEPEFSYKILRPQTTITNTTNITNYSNYLNLSLNSDIKLMAPSVDLNFIGKKYTFGIGYMPRQEAITINFGYNLIKF